MITTDQIATDIYALVKNITIEMSYLYPYVVYRGVFLVKVQCRTSGVCFSVFLARSFADWGFLAQDERSSIVTPFIVNTLKPLQGVGLRHSLYSRACFVSMPEHNIHQRLSNHKIWNMDFVSIDSISSVFLLVTKCDPPYLGIKGEILCHSSFYNIFLS